LMTILRTIPEFKPFEVVVAEELIDCHLDDPKGSGYCVLIAEADSSLAGYVCYGPTPLTEGTWDVYWLAVAPEKQGRGIGSSLLEAAENEMRKVQARLSIIETSATPLYEKTRRFHLSHGYEIAGHVPDFYAPGDGKLIMVKRLR
jgi:ribosomal protein S18 acetylase RimI-like enzyme